MGQNPYSAKKDHCFWRRSISRTPRFAVNPACTEPKFKILKSDKVATVGSCFAQHIANRLDGLGYNFYVPESGENYKNEERKKLGYGVFSARYGNIYNVIQLNQLFKETLGMIPFSESLWQRPDGRFVDPLRPSVEPDGYSEKIAVLRDRELHLSFVKDVMIKSDVLIFTLGLTEGWILRKTGRVLPIAPGVIAGEYSDNEYEFKNHSVLEVMADLFESLEILKEVNPNIKVLLTVSPVPLKATYEDHHVLTSTTYSKSVLRVAAEEAVKRFSWVDYFASYETITGPHAQGKYYSSDLREVNARGIEHVMRIFHERYTDIVEPSSMITFSSNYEGSVPSDEVVCDEDAIDRITK